MNRSVRQSVATACFSVSAGLAAWGCPAKILAVGPAPSLFLEDFNSGQQNPLLEGYERFTLDNGAIRRNGTFQDGNDRQYMRTLATNYNEIDFRYELTFTTTVLPNSSIMFMGIGSGDRRPGSSFGHNEPWDSLFFRAHTPNTAGGKVSVSNSPARDLDIIGTISAGTHRGRIEKVDDAVTFSVDANYNGVFAADMSRTYSDLAAVAPFLNNTNSRIFFGTVFPNDIFDDMSVVPEPSTLALATAGVLLALFRRRQ